MHMGYELFEELDKKVKDLDSCLKVLRENGIKLAEKEMQYKMALTKKVLELNSQEVKATIINLTIYGYDEIAKLRFERDSQKAIYESNIEAINIIKLQIKVLQEQINKEYSNA